ncbi:hypothetical protein ACUJ40_13550 [Halococcus saccharolyticus]
MTMTSDPATQRRELEQLAAEVVDENRHMASGVLTDDLEERHAHLDALANEALDMTDGSPLFPVLKRAIRDEVRDREGVSACCGALIRTTMYGLRVCSRCRREVDDAD